MIMASAAAQCARHAAGMLLLHVLSVTFLHISPQPALRSWTWLYYQKANET